MHECETMTGVSTQEEADTLMIYHAVEDASSGMNVHIYPQDTSVLFLALRTTQLLGDRSAAIMGTTEIRRKVFIHPIYDKLGPGKSGVLINWHALTDSDTTGHTHENGKNGCFATFKKANPTTMIALAGHGRGDAPSEEVLRCCEDFLCSLFCPGGVRIGETNMRRWFLFKQLRDEQGVDKLPATHGAWIEHMRRAHVQANI